MSDDLRAAREALWTASRMAVEQRRARESAEYLGLAGRISQWLHSGGAVESVVLWRTAADLECLGDRAMREDWPELDSLDDSANAVAAAAVRGEGL